MEEQVLAFFKTFADARRIRMAALLLDESLSVEELAARLNIQTGEVLRHLGMLDRLGLLTKNEGRQRIDPKALEALSRGALARPRTQEEPPRSPEEAQERAVARAFFTPEGRLREMPSQQAKRVAALRLVARMFEPGRRYTEKEVNAMLLKVYDDPASLRRYLFDTQLLNRAQDGSAYWREE